jgi:predicted RecB family endonuclease
MGRKCIGERPMTPRERAKKSQEQLVQSGGTMVSIRVLPDLMYAINDIQRALNLTSRTKAIELAIYELANNLNAERDDENE